MKRITTLLTISAFAIGLAACGGDDSSGSGDDDTGGEDSDMGTTGDATPPNTSTPTPTTITATASAGTADESGTDDESGEEEGETGEAPDFNFSETPPEDLDQVDRMGMPAINTAVIASKDDYNEATPEDDIAGDFVPEIIASLEFLHGALDDDLIGAGLVPCAVDDCVAQAAPLVVPDVLQIDPGADAGFPNGRRPADPVIDIVLAVILLDLSEPGQDAGTLAGLPLNPPVNDVDFLGEFPFLAAPH